MWEVDLIKLATTFWLKPIIILCLFLAASKTTKNRSAAFAYKILQLGVLVVLCVLLFSYLLPTIQMQVIPSYLNPLVSFNLQTSLAEATNIWLLLVGLYVFIMLAITTFIFNAFFSTLALVRQTNKLCDPRVERCLSELKRALNIDKSLDVYALDSIYSPAVFGHYNVKLFLPENYRNWSDERLVRVLTHEMAHVARSDWINKLWIHFSAAVFWFVFPIWQVKKRMEWQAELAADDIVLNMHGNRSEYAQDLLEFVSDGMLDKHLYIRLVRGSEVFRRIDHILDSGCDRDACTSVSLGRYWFIAFILILCFSTVHLSVQKNSASQRQVLVPIPLVEQEKIAVNETETVEYEMPKMDQTVVPVRQLVRTEETVIRAEKTEQIPPNINIDWEPIGVLTPEVSIIGPIAAHLVTPTYPRMAVRRNIEGDVVVTFDVNEEGGVENIRFLSSNPKGVFNKTVEQALSQSRFVPMQMGGQTIRVNGLKEEYQFKLVSSTTK